MYGSGSQEDTYEALDIGLPRKAKRGKSGREERAEEYRADGFIAPNELDDNAGGGGRTPGSAPAAMRRMASSA